MSETKQNKKGEALELTKTYSMLDHNVIKSY